MDEQLEPNKINVAGHLTIGGVDATELAHQYGTPLIAYDVAAIRQQFRRFNKVFEENQAGYEVSYASKAFATVGMFQVVAQEKGHIDVVSGGELYTAIKAGFPMDKISFHGNNKSRAELEMAVEHQIGVVIVDNFHEIELLSEILEQKKQTMNVMIRITPGISAHTHKYDQTGQEDSKFGFDIQSGQAEEALKQILTNPRMTMIGIHTHIGSQIFEVEGFVMAANKLVDLAADWHDKFDLDTQVLNVGGGFGIRYTKEDDPIAPEKFVDAIIKAVQKRVGQRDLKMPAIWIEPGRSIVGPAGYSLYTIGSRKDVPGLLPYVTVDGGMGDNIRPALYQADYEAVLANRASDKNEETVRIAGKYCESGDILIQKQALPKSQPGDTLAILATGAYGYSMASNYNRNPRPAVVFVENGQSKLVVKRESYEDLVRLDQDFI
ncbi:Diaminopimelate decarboxylase [Pediococcus damnosus]|uniref:diaminopimelate decarboxylase n=1 Tax=Pediococcus damnosus TaxID=51663 RepID=UPI00078E4ACE|nr:diaminopimelate decarboxylase [Pediococcus damnosus]AMV60829.1 Diaminopimelate decarboxylase [Pediococcus damnosus]AMV65139.1 Diaminopimelate decarboxylase [Pediococcus damnosus]